MKKILYIINALAIIFIFGSCSDFLDTNSPSKSTVDVVFENDDEANMAVLGVYDVLTRDQTYSQDLSLVFTAGSDVEIRTHGNTDEAKGYSFDDARAPAHFMATANNGKLERAWENLYLCIERANLVVASIENSSHYQNSSSSFHANFKRYRAEAIVLRALCYLELTRNWGDVMFKIEPTKSDLSNVYLQKLDRFEIFEALVDQLIDCADDLEWQNLTPERVTQGFARGLAARFALYRAGYNYTRDSQWVAPDAEDAKEWYEVARDQCDYVMQHGGYSLENTYFDYFRKQCERQYSNNETLYEIGFQLRKSSELVYSIGVRYKVSTAKWGYATQATIATTPAMYYSYHPKDDRRDISVAYYEYDKLEEVVGENGVSMNLYSTAQDFKINKWSNKWTPDDFRQASFAASGKVGSGVNYPIMRYSDILLMFAEAEFHVNGVTQDAKDALWQVRKRAMPSLTAGEFETYLNTKKTKGDDPKFLAAVKDERKWEFLGEGHRKFDLIRWGDLVDALKDMRTENYAIAVDRVYDFEFPSVDVAGGTTSRAIPEMVYYIYDSKNEDFADINLDYVRDIPSDLYFSSEWFYGKYDKGKDAETARKQTDYYWRSSSAGVVNPDGVPVFRGRPFYPIPSTVITAYNGKLQQDYNF